MPPWLPLCSLELRSLCEALLEASPLLGGSTVTLTSSYPLFLFLQLLSLLFFYYLLFSSFNLWCLRLDFLLKLASKPYPICFLGTLPCLYTSLEEVMLFFPLKLGVGWELGKTASLFYLRLALSSQ